MHSKPSASLQNSSEAAGMGWQESHEPCGRQSRVWAETILIHVWLSDHWPLVTSTSLTFFSDMEKWLHSFRLLSVFGSVHKSLWNPIQSPISSSSRNEQKCLRSSVEKVFIESNEILVVWQRWILVLGSTSILTMLTANGHVSNSESLRLVTKWKQESRMEAGQD